MNYSTIQLMAPCPWPKDHLTTSQRVECMSHLLLLRLSKWLLTKQRLEKAYLSHLQRIPRQLLTRFLVLLVTNLIKLLISLTSKELVLQLNNNNYILKRLKVTRAPKREAPNRIEIKCSRTKLLQQSQTLQPATHLRWPLALTGKCPLTPR